MGKITSEQYQLILPINDKYSKWLDDKISTMRIYKPFAHLFPEIYYHIFKREDGWRIISENYEESMLAVLNLPPKKTVDLTDSVSSDRFEIKYSNSLSMLNQSVKEEDIFKNDVFSEKLINDNWRTDVHMLVESVRSDYLERHEVLRVYMLNTEGDNPKIGDIYLVGGETSWRKVTSSNEFIDFKEIEKEFTKICLHTPQLEFFAIDLIPIKKGSNQFKIVRMHANPPYPHCPEDFSDEINTYLQARLEAKKNTLQSIEEVVSTNKVRYLYPKGFYPHFEMTDFLASFKFDPSESLNKKSWAHKRGFSWHRIDQYGINGLNHRNFISDIEYKYLGHFNNKYRSWFNDKITIKYILSDFSECLPDYYYLIEMRNGENRIFPLMDCPEGYQSSYADLFRLVQEKGILALKPDEGTHGAGFFKFTFMDEKYYLNEKEVTEEKVIQLLSDVNNQYLVTEFIKQHSSIARIYPGSVNTARLTVFKKDGKIAQIGNGYMRFGTNETGGVDNIGAGGIGVDLDLTTGYYSNAARMRDGRLESLQRHPDTGILIEGQLPNWDNVTQIVLKIAEAVPEIEYMGFDIAFTEDGIKLPEINRIPDFPMINKVTAHTMDYLLDKLKKKKAKYGYAGKKARRPFGKLSKQKLNIFKRG